MEITNCITTNFSHISEDIILNIFLKLEDDPRHWSRLACVCTRFDCLIRNVCWKNKCSTAIPSIVSDLLQKNTIEELPGGWASLQKVAVCCPGLLHAGVLFESSDFGLEREIGPDENYVIQKPPPPQNPPCSSGKGPSSNDGVSVSVSADCSWSLYDDLYFDTVYDVSESKIHDESCQKQLENVVIEVGSGFSVQERVGFENGSHGFKRRKRCKQSVGSHLASGVWNLSREQGNKLLASRFRGDCLYICDWPGCLHTEEKRNYMLFRGVFKNFKGSRVWRTIKDANRSKLALNCAFCSCKETWDLHSAFCLRRVFGYHDDGEPVVRAYVCENGHVSGAWTDRPMKKQGRLCSYGIKVQLINQPFNHSMG